MTTATVHINLAAVSANFQKIKQYMPNQKILAMIKSNAYGHGLVPVAKAIAKADAFGVATIAEALCLREARVKNNIVVMRGFLNEEELSVFLKDTHLFASVYHEQQITLLERYLKPYQSIAIWLKIDTGMHRLGFLPEQFHSIYKRLLTVSGVKQPMTFFSHLADADSEDNVFTQKQLTQFQILMQNVAGEKSLLNSAGILVYHDHHYDWIRPGLLLYGASPFKKREKYRDRLQHFSQAMTLQATVIAIKTVRAGEKIGYGCAFESATQMKVGIVCGGYGDGYPHHAKSGTPVLIRGKRCPLVGRVSMDMIAVDLSHVVDAEVGDVAILWGEQLPVETIAVHADTVAYELLTRMTPRVAYTYL